MAEVAELERYFQSPAMTPSSADLMWHCLILGWEDSSFSVSVLASYGES